MLNSSEQFPKIVKNTINQIISVKLKEFKMSLNKKDSFVILKDEKIVKIHRISYDDNVLKCSGEYINNISDFFTFPCDSKMFGIYLLVGEKYIKGYIEFSVDSVLRKCFQVPMQNHFIVVPLLQ